MKRRGHFAIKFTAAVMRLGSILLVIGGLIGGLAFTQFQASTLPSTVPAAASAIAYVVAVAFALIYAIILWGFADALVLIADTNDAQRVSQEQIAMLMTERREPTVMPTATTERLLPPDR